MSIWQVNNSIVAVYLFVFILQFLSFLLWVISLLSHFYHNILDLFLIQMWNKHIKFQPLFIERFEWKWLSFFLVLNGGSSSVNRLLAAWVTLNLKVMMHLWKVKKQYCFNNTNRTSGGNGFFLQFKAWHWFMFPFATFSCLSSCGVRWQLHCSGDWKGSRSMVLIVLHLVIVSNP